MRNDNPRGHNPNDDDGSTDVEQPAECGCTSSLSCFEHYRNADADDDTDAENAVPDGGLSRIPHTPNLGDLYVIGGTAYEVACFADKGSTVVFEPIAQSTSEVIMPVNTVRTTDAASYVR